MQTPLRRKGLLLTVWMLLMLQVFAVPPQGEALGQPDAQPKETKDEVSPTADTVRLDSVEELKADSSVLQSRDLVVVANAAQVQVRSFLDRIPVGMESRYGFKDRSEFQRTKIGTVYPMYTIHPDDLRSGELGMKAVRALGSYRVMLMVDGSARALLTVEKVEGAWKAVDFGATKLAKELDRVHRGLRVNEAGNPVVGLVRLYQLKCDLLLLDAGQSRSDLHLFPLESATRSLGIKADLGSPGALRDYAPIMKKAMLTADRHRTMR